MTDWTTIPERRGEPDFDNLLAVLRREVPARPTLFEFFLNDRLEERLAPMASIPAGPYRAERQVLQAYCRAGYDFANVRVPDFRVSHGARLLDADDVPQCRRPDRGLDLL